jgi:hypothetical protein
MTLFADSLRVIVVMGLCLAWLLAFSHWVLNPYGPWGLTLGLLAFVGLGVAAWIAPFQSRSERTMIRAVGTVVGMVALLVGAFLLGLRDL